LNNKFVFYLFVQKGYSFGFLTYVCFSRIDFLLVFLIAFLNCAYHFVQHKQLGSKGSQVEIPFMFQALVLVLEQTVEPPSQVSIEKEKESKFIYFV